MAGDVVTSLVVRGQPVVSELEILDRGADHLEAANDDGVAVPGVGTREGAPN